ncbi:MAG: hypothetical protein KME27_28435 [Lyngbya sp. HA4199-MV5]|jgi:hypothetical protein|nr:hypothetical protein [Lyngbya sp. HA4199-MV5]
MLEQEREAFYWRISLFLMFISPWILYSLAKMALNPFVGLFLFKQAIIFKQVIIIGMFANIAIVILLEMLYSRIIKGKTSFKFWVVKPSVEYRNRAQGSIKGCTHAIEQKLNCLGFQTDVSNASSTDGEEQMIQFQKSVKKPVHHFLNHAFSGKVMLKPAFNGVEIYVQLTFEDTLILETGEMSKLQAISEFIALKSSELQMKGVPFTLCCGLIFAYATIIAGAFVSMGWSLNYAVVNSLALSGIGTILLSLFFSLKNGKDFMGWRLVFSGLYLAATPYSAWMLATFI